MRFAARSFLRSPCRLLGLAMTWALLPACNPGSGNAGEVEVSCMSEVSAEDYEQGCSVDADCAAMFEGPVSAPCRCANAAVSTNELASYESDLGPDLCHDPTDCLADCNAQVEDQGACVENQCVLGTPFDCGGQPCNGQNQFCLTLGSDIADTPASFSCVTLPPECTDTTDCSCFRDAELSFDADACLDEGSCNYGGGWFALSCPGG